MLFCFKKNTGVFGYSTNQQGSGLLLVILLCGLLSALLLTMEVSYINAIKQQDIYSVKMLVNA